MGCELNLCGLVNNLGELSVLQSRQVLSFEEESHGFANGDQKNYKISPHISWIKGKTTWLCQLGPKLARIPRVTDTDFPPKI
jgi:hypothetical protein